MRSKCISGGLARVILMVISISGLNAALAAPATADSEVAYLFAHMMKSHYGVLYYSVSLDGLHWKLLNRGQPVYPPYHGHASIAKGADGRYYLVGNKGDDDPSIRFWSSSDLIDWSAYATFQPDLSAVEGLPHPLQRIGAPKLFFDRASGRFLLTWHTPTVPGSPSDPEAYWASQRTLYVMSKDLKEFKDPPARFFSWDMATIDTTIVANPEGGYCAVLKDERYPSYNWITGKTVRMSCAPSLLGPYVQPGPPLSPNFREAPTVIPSPDGRDWYLYYEQYAGTSYGLSMAPRLAGPWYQVSGNTGVPEWNKYEMTPEARHGSMQQITRAQYDKLVRAFPEK